MASNPYTECAKFETQERRDKQQRDDAIARANALYMRKRKARLDRLTPDEVAIIEARERALAAQQPPEVPDLDQDADTRPPVDPPAEPRTSTIIDLGAATAAADARDRRKR
jgi:hypothetical protein